MQIRNDDEVYRVNSVWLGPPKATMPWHVRYVAWGIGLVLFFVVLSVQRAVGFGFGFFSTAWALVITIVLTRLAARLINYERPLGAVLSLFVSEVRTPRERTTMEGGAFRTSRAVRVSMDRPRPSVPAAPEPVEAGLDLLVDPSSESGSEPAPVRPRRRLQLGKVWAWLIAPLWFVGFLVGGAVLAAVGVVGRGGRWLWLALRRVRVSRPRRVPPPFPHRGEPLPRRDVSSVRRHGPEIEPYQGGVN